ncbi:MAG: DEAD/DEAH box helicase [Bacteroidota bacterium]
MPSDTPPTNRYTQVIDLTTRAQKHAKQQVALEKLADPEEALPQVEVGDLPPRIQEAVQAAGWPSLTKVQQQAIPYMLDRRDLIVQSRTGSGKTGAFLLPLFELIDSSTRGTQVLILTPTRELARQINEEFERMRLRRDDADTLEGVLIYGGVKYGPQIDGLERGVQVVIGTPGRILDHIQRGTLKLHDLRVLILDEADEMLSMGFYPAMRDLKQYLPEPRQSYMYSATMPPNVRALGNLFLKDPGFLSLSIGHQSVDTIEHRYYKVEPMERDRALIRIIEMEHPDSAIIFANTKREVEYLATFLQNYGHDADAISGDLSQQQRERVMDRIRKANLRFLVATDVAARGIDISDLSHVFMHEVPQDPESYLHRAGRTGRIGKTGTAIVLVTRLEERALWSIARRYNFEPEERPLPTDDDVTERIGERLTVHLETLRREKTNLERERAERFVPLAQNLAREEPQLLAILLDGFYHELLHRPGDQPSVEEAEAGAQTRHAETMAPDAETEAAPPAPQPSSRRRKSRSNRSRRNDK